MENKKIFVENLGKLIADYNKTSGSNHFDGIIQMKYVKEGNEEFLYACYEEKIEKRVCITADSVEGILSDFVKQIDSAEWLSSSDKRYRKF